MSIFSGDFALQFSALIDEAVKQSVDKIVENVNSEEKFLLNRKGISEAIGCDVDTFDNSFRYLPGFPFHMKGKTEAWNKKEVFDYLHAHGLKK